MKLTTKYLLALITTLLLLNLSVAEARRTSGMAALANIGPAGPTGPAGARGVTGTSAPVHAIGENYQGGIIFWVDADGQHGLIASNVILGSGVTWDDGYVVSPYQYLNTGATGDGIYAGIGNTANLVAQQNAMSAQASIAAAMGPPLYQYSNWLVLQHKWPMIIVCKMMVQRPVRALLQKLVGVIGIYLQNLN